MRVGELSTRTGVPVPTIKYYLREGLLPPGELTSPNQAQYGDAHVRRLKLVRALLEVGKLSVAAARTVLDSIDAPGAALHDVLGAAQHAITPIAAGDPDSTALLEARGLTDRLIADRGWLVEADGPARDALTQVVLTYRDLGQDDMLGLIDAYADAVERLAAAEVAAVGRRPDPDSQVEGLVLGTVLGEALLTALRRLAHENASARVFTAGVPAGAPTGA
ncbi:MerR family transcriptional regulator [Kitasatospora sp. NBC_00315]|uniref:MerR family transcriptional regulator n=1 Tax=Kitasatospora sp. NBC_00315 TaxID=2975963 RepID=UPI003243E393